MPCSWNCGTLLFSRFSTTLVRVVQFFALLDSQLIVVYRLEDLLYSTFNVRLNIFEHFWNTFQMKIQAEVTKVAMRGKADKVAVQYDDHIEAAGDTHTSALRSWPSQRIDGIVWSYPTPVSICTASRSSVTFSFAFITNLAGVLLEEPPSTSTILVLWTWATRFAKHHVDLLISLSTTYPALKNLDAHDLSHFLPGTNTPSPWSGSTPNSRCSLSWTNRGWRVIGTTSQSTDRAQYECYLDVPHFRRTPQKLNM